MRSLILLLAATGLMLGCDGAKPKAGKRVVPTDSVPELVMKAAQARVPDVKFDTVIKADGFYEVRGKGADGKIVEVEVSEAGEVLQVE